jgi:hypothetical protein
MVLAVLNLIGDLTAVMDLVDAIDTRRITRQLLSFP